MNNESFTHKMASLNLPLETRNIGFQKLREASLIHTMLGIDDGAAVYKITRLRILADEPAAIHISYLPETLFHKFKRTVRTSGRFLNISINGATEIRFRIICS